jgi:hypothetical protein
MALVSGVTMSVVQVVDMVAMRDRVVTAAITMLVGMAVMDDVSLELALVPVVVVGEVHMAVVQVVDVIAVLDRHVLTARPVDVVMTGMDIMSRGAHPETPLEGVKNPIRRIRP